MPETILIASDHGGYPLKEEVKNFLEKNGYTIVDLGTHSNDSVDYPDFAESLAQKISKNEYTRGILMCGTGIGVSIAANKFPNVRAALVYDEFTAQMAKKHNDANILVLGGRTTTPEIAKKLVMIWLNESFEGGRHIKRLEKINHIENKKHESPKKRS